MRKPDGVSLAKEIPLAETENYTKGKPKKLGIGFIAFILMDLLILAAILFFVTNNNKKEEVTYFGDKVVAEEKCEGFVKDKLGNPDLMTFDQKQSVQDTRTLVDYEVIGSVEAVNDAGETTTHSYKCDMVYLPETDGWSSDTFVSE